MSSEDHKEKASGSSTARGVEDLTSDSGRGHAREQDESTVELIRKYLAEKLGFMETIRKQKLKQRF